MISKIFIIAATIALASTRPNSSLRIVGGRNVFLGEIPYQASLRYFGTREHFAGGVLLNSRWVLTTAHGVWIQPGNGIEIVLGITRIDTGASLRSSEIRVHPLFDNILRLNDIATIRSSEVIEFSSFISPIPLSPSMIGDGIRAYVSGWGATNENATSQSLFLQKAEVTTSSCIDSEFMTFSAFNHICAGGKGSTAGICTTDVGGPLVTDYMLIGVPFYHDPRGCGMFVDGYIRVSAYRAWIMGNIPE